MCYPFFVMFGKAINFILGFAILFGFYYLSDLVIKLLHITFPPAVLGLILFSISLLCGIIKEKWVELSVNFILKNMPLLFVPFVVGLSTYKELLMKNVLSIMLAVLVATTVTIVVTGVFVEYGIKYLRLYKMRRKDD